tara:strand:+ start:4319 stop:4846 length:528 start_codon:yes stop_codon:yes gene_type:complete
MTASNKDLLIITASNGENLKLAEKFEKSAQKLGANSEVLDLTKQPLPLFNPRTQQDDAIPELVQSLNEKMQSMPRWIICSPEYNGSIPPILTNTIAWLSIQEKDFRTLFNGRPIAIASFSGGEGMEVLLSMRIQLTHLGAQVVGRQLSSNSRKPPKDKSIEDLIMRILQMNPLKV